MKNVKIKVVSVSFLVLFLAFLPTTSATTPREPRNDAYCIGFDTDKLEKIEPILEKYRLELQEMNAYMEQNNRLSVELQTQFNAICNEAIAVLTAEGAYKYSDLSQSQEGNEQPQSGGVTKIEVVPWFGTFGPGWRYGIFLNDGMTNFLFSVIGPGQTTIIALILVALSVGTMGTCAWILVSFLVNFGFAAITMINEGNGVIIDFIHYTLPMAWFFDELVGIYPQ